MNKRIFSNIIIVFLFACLSSCNNNPSPQEKEEKTGTETVKKRIDVQQLLAMKTAGSSGNYTAPFYYTLQPVSLKCYMPALQSFVFATYNGLWIFIGGQKNGFHGTANVPVPFPTKVANDSMWVVDFNNQKSWGMPVFPEVGNALSATNSAYCQVGNLLYMCGGFTTNGQGTSFNSTSNNFFEIDLAQLVQYIQTGNSQSPIITKQIQSPYVQVTGGAMMYSNGYFYLIGGQNYSTNYNSGTTGNYTNAIRMFMLQQQNGGWILADTASVIDAVNLHRRDMNVVPGPPGYGQGAILYGGVFTKRDEAYRNAVFIDNLSTGNPTIVVDTMQQDVNQYSCAVASYIDTVVNVAFTSFFGGITYKMFDKDSNKVVVGDHGVPMPFSNIASTIVTGGGINNSKEFIQLPPEAPLLPGYIGSNAVFIPNPQFSMANVPKALDLAKINADTSARVITGYIVGGIVSKGPTSGTTPQGFVPTYANPVVYAVYLNYPGVH